MTTEITDNDLKKLKEKTQHIHPNKKLPLLKRVLLPFHSFSVSVMATKRTGPKELDKIFFDLIQNKINTRKQIAQRLGVDEDEFIFNHLDILIQAGYISIEKENIYSITEHGRHFVSGKFEEECFEKIPFKFIWGEIMNRIETDVPIIKNTKKNQHSHTHNEIKHDERPVNDELLTSLAEHFNKVEGKNKFLFYDIDPSKNIKHFRVYAEYVALFYTPQNNENNLHIDLRVRDKDDSSQFSLCRELSEKINKEEYWYEQFKGIHENDQFKDIHEKETLARGENLI